VRAALLCICLPALDVVATRADAKTLKAALGGETSVFGPVADALAESVGRSLVLTAVSSPLRYSFDEESGAFVRDRTLTGLAYLERPEPIGRRQWSLLLSYQRFVFDEFEGKNLDRLRDDTPLVDKSTGRPTISLHAVAIDIETDQVALGGTYGLTDRLDLNLTVPLISTALTRRDRIRSFLGLGPESIEGTASASAFGTGDIRLAGNYVLTESDPVRIAAALAVRLPTGNPDDFQGTGSAGVEPAFHASSARWSVSQSLALRMILNGGLSVDAADVSGSEGRWGLGLDASMGKRLAFAVEMLGRHAFDRIAPEGTFDFRRCVDRISTCLSRPLSSKKALRPLFGFDGGRPDYYDLSIGGRVNLWHERLIAFANVLIPLDENGVGTAPVPLAGFEASF